MFHKQHSFLLAASFGLAVLCNGCEEKLAPIQWNYGKDEITGKDVANTEKLSVDVYLDATTSMKGFVSDSPTNFSKLLEDIEGTCQNVWKNTDIQFYKFGRSVAAINRSEFVSAKTSPLFFSDPQLSTQTNFAEAVRNTNPKRVSILITDLFYNNNDVNLVVKSIKDSCINKVQGLETGIIGLASAFNGIVADVQPPVKVNGERPVYVLVFGEKQNINLLFNTLGSKEYIKANQFLLITERLTKEFEVAVTKNKKCGTINVAQGTLGADVKSAGTVYGFKMDIGATEAELHFAATIAAQPNIAAYSEKNLKAMVYKKAASAAKGKTSDKQSATATGSSFADDAVLADNEVKIENLKLTGNKLTGDVKLINKDKVGVYAYLVYLVLDNTIAPPIPAWVREVNAETFSQGNNENKTLNFEKLVTDISTNYITSRTPKVIKFYINIEKK